jgi:hypothetical protein
MNGVSLSNESKIEFLDGLMPADEHKLITFRPQPRQQVLLEACGLWDFYQGGEVHKAVAPYIGYGGAAFGGKSYGALGVADVAAYAWPGLNIGFFRRTYPELTGPDGAMEKSFELFSRKAQFIKSERRWRWENGSNLFFLHCQSEEDKYKYQSQAFDILIVDEATHFNWSIIDYLITRVRATGDWPVFMPFVLMMTNPGNIGHAWFSQVFDVQGELKGKEGKSHEQVKHTPNPNNKYQDIFFIPAFLEDNEIGVQRDPDYEKRLMERDPAVAAALRHGDWSVFAGQAIREWNYDIHTCEPFEIPVQWPIARGVDWGYTAPWCALWMAQDPDSLRLYVYRELYQTGLTDRQQARMIRSVSEPWEYKGEKYLRGSTYADPSMWAKKTVQDIVTSSEDEYRQEGVPLTKADNDRISGKRKIHRVLRPLADGRPGLIIFRSCVNLIRTLPQLPLDERNPEDVDTGAEDHPYDTLRYLLSSTQPRPAEGQKKKKEKSGIERGAELDIF